MALASVQVNVRSRLPAGPAESADLSDVAPVNVNELVDDGAASEPRVVGLEDVVAGLVDPAANADSAAASSSSRRSGPRAGEGSSEAGYRDARGRRRRAASGPIVVKLVEFGSAQLTREVLAQLFTATGTPVLLFLFNLNVIRIVSYINYLLVVIISIRNKTFLLKRMP